MEASSGQLFGTVTDLFCVSVNYFPLSIIVRVVILYCFGWVHDTAALVGAEREAALTAVLDVYVVVHKEPFWRASGSVIVLNSRLNFYSQILRKLSLLSELPKCKFTLNNSSFKDLFAFVQYHRDFLGKINFYDSFFLWTRNCDKCLCLNLRKCVAA